MTWTEKEVWAHVMMQAGGLIALAEAADVEVLYLKPHGALYSMACRDDAYARPVVAAAELFELPLVALPGSRLGALSAGRCGFIAEGFADRRYLPDRYRDADRAALMEQFAGLKLRAGRR